MAKQLELFKAAAPGPMDASTSTAVEESWAKLLEQGVRPQMQLAQQGTVEEYRRHANGVTPRSVANSARCRKIYRGGGHYA